MGDHASSALSARQQGPTAGDWAKQFRAEGFAIVRQLFSADEIAELAAAFDRLYALGVSHGSSVRRGPLFFEIAEDANLGRILRYLQWPSYIDEVLDRIRLDTRMLAVVGPLIGEDLKQIINQLHWKPPGAAMTDFGLHQDITFRRPREAYRNAGETYVQTGIAIDPHRRDNGALLVYPGSHRLGELPLRREGRVLDTPLVADDLARVGLDPAGLIPIELDPGDVALWHLYTVHGSGANRSAIDRRFYINGYVRADNCDVGRRAFRRGQPVPLCNSGTDQP